MIEFELGTAAVQRVRFRVSPLEELAHLMRVALGLRPHPARTLPWLIEATATLTGLPVDDLAALMADPGYLCDFLCPPPVEEGTSVAEQLHGIRTTDPDRVAHDLKLSRTAPTRLSRDPHAARELLADQMELVWREVVEPVWAPIQNVLTADIAHRAAELGSRGLAAVLADLTPRMRLVDVEGRQSLLIRSDARVRTELGSRGLILVPSVFVWPRVGVVANEAWQPAVVYPARHSAALWSTTERRRDDALERLIGRTRALLLEALHTPATTSQLTRQFALSPGTVSEHLSVLRDAGLLSATRHRHAVVYAHTALADSLLHDD